MFPVFLNIYQPQGYYPQFPFVFNTVNGMQPYYPKQQIEQVVNNLHEINSFEIQQQENVENSSEKSEKVMRRKIKKTDNDYRIKDQNAQRNIISNIAHHLMSFVRKDMFTKELVEKIIRIHNIAISSEEFFAIFKKIKLRNYVRRITIEDLWNNRLCPEFTKVFRILSYNFLNQKCYSSILFSRKIKRPLKPHHLPKIRQLCLLLRKERLY